MQFETMLVIQVYLYVQGSADVDLQEILIAESKFRQF